MSNTHESAPLSGRSHHRLANACTGRRVALDGSTTVDSSLASLLPGRGLLDSRVARGIEDALMSVVPADAVVLVPCLAEHLQDLADPASLADPVALNNHQVAYLRSGRILCWSHRNAPFSTSPTTSLLSAGRIKHQRRLPDRVVAGCTGAALPPEA